MLAVLALLGAAAFPLYWMLVTSLTPSSDLFAARPRLLPKLVRDRRLSRGVSTASRSTTWLAQQRDRRGRHHGAEHRARHPAGLCAVPVPLPRQGPRWASGCSSPRCCPRPCWWCRCTRSSANLALLNTLGGPDPRQQRLHRAGDHLDPQGRDRRRADRHRGGGAHRRLLADRHRSRRRAPAGRADARRGGGHRLLPRLERIRLRADADQQPGAAHRLGRAWRASSAS